MIFFASIQLYAGTWSAPSLINISAKAARTAVYCSYDTSTNLIMATWNDFVSNNPTYAIFDGVTWSAPAPIELSVAQNNIFSSYNSLLDRTVATWTDNVTGDPVYSVYNGSSWTSSAPIIATQQAISDSVFTAFVLDKTYAIWLDSFDIPYLSSYEGGAWSAPMEVSTGEYSGIILNSYDSIRMHTISTWNDLATSTPFFSIFDGMNWSDPAMIQNTPVFSKGVFSVFDNTSGQTFAIWLNPLFMLEYSIYDGMAWGPVLNVGASFGLGNVFLTFDFIRNQILATWIDPLSRPVYAIYTP